MGQDGTRHLAPDTFDTLPAAESWLDGRRKARHDSVGRTSHAELMSVAETLAAMSARLRALAGVS